MKRNLCLFLASLLVFLNSAYGNLSQEDLNEINRYRQSKNAIFNEPKIRHSKLNSNGPFCQKLVAYYEGTFVNQQNSNLNYTAQFQVRLNADKSEKRIYVMFDQWNNTLLANNDFSFDFLYGGRDIPGDQIGASYWGPFSSQTDDDDFTLTLDHAKHQKWDNSIHILYFNVFNNSFQLENSIGQCTSNQLDLRNVWNMNPSLVNYCVCCGDYLPDPLLNCPINPWHEQLTTKKVPATTTKKAPTTTTVKPTPVPTPQNITCQKITGYFVGTFQDPNNRARTLNGQFQFTLDANLNDKKIYFNLQHWNQSYSDGRYVDFTIYDDAESTYGNVNNGNLSMSIKFVQSTGYFLFQIAKSTHEYYFQIFDYPSPKFNNSFPLVNTINGCTKSQPLYNVDSCPLPDPSLYSYCLCCGDYNPSPPLKCPANPWL